MKIMMFNGLFLFLLFILTSAAISPQSKLTPGLQLDGQVRHVDIQARGRECKALEGRCFKEDDVCPDDMPLEEIGMPYCKKGKKCCYPDEYTEAECGVGNNGICFGVGTLCMNIIDAKCPENHVCCDRYDGTTLVDAVQAHVDKSGVGCCPLIPPPLCTVLGCCCTDQNDITPLTDAVQEYIKDPTVICCPLIPFPACIILNCCCFSGTILVDAVQANIDKSGVECCPFIPPPLCTILGCCCTDEHDITALTDAVQAYVKDPTVSCCPLIPFPLCMIMGCCCG